MRMQQLHKAVIEAQIPTKCSTRHPFSTRALCFMHALVKGDIAGNPWNDLA